MGAQTAFSELAARPAKIAQPAVVVRGRPRITACVLLAADILAILVARVLIFRTGSVSLALFVLAYGVLGLYSAGLSAVEELRRVVLGTVLVSTLLAVRGGSDATSLILSGLLTAVAVPFVRSITRNVFASRAWWGVPVIVLGAGPAAKRLIERLRNQPEVGFKPVACFDGHQRNHAECALLARTLGVRHALVVMPEHTGEDFVRALDEWRAAFQHVILIPNPLGLSSLWASPRDIGGTLGLEMRRNDLNLRTKRALDIAGALVLGILSLPILAAAAIWIKCTSQGSVFYSQEREGENGHPVRIPKIRTMHPDAEALLTQALSESSEVRAEWSARFKLREDPRILPGVGKFLRRTSLDELPQVWSVLKGEMSLVGPRPFPSYHLNGFSERFRTLRARVKPGLTGLWQVSDRADGDLKVQETLDTYYIRNWSLWLDLYILARTVRAVLFPKGAY